MAEPARQPPKLPQPKLPQPQTPPSVIELQAIPLADLQSLARNAVPPHLGSPVIDGALPPAFVAARSLQQWQAGTPQRWCSSFYMRRRADLAIVGSCGFKHPPQAGRVEIGYGVATACRNQGVARQAVAALLLRAFEDDEGDGADEGPAAHEVLAQVNPDNGPSTRVVRSLGFQHEGLATDADGELLAQWVFRRPQPIP